MEGHGPASGIVFPMRCPIQIDVKPKGRNMIPGRSEASAVIWNWRQADSARSSRDRRRRLRFKGLIQGAVGAVLGVLIFSFVSQILGVVILVVAGATLFATLVSPQGLYARFERTISFSSPAHFKDLVVAATHETTRRH